MSDTLHILETTIKNAVRSKSHTEKDEFLQEALITIANAKGEIFPT